MDSLARVTSLRSVALRKESVDRNQSLINYAFKHPQSLSARRAWIEIVQLMQGVSTDKVALRKESVDRNGLLRAFML